MKEKIKKASTILVLLLKSTKFIKVIQALKLMKVSKPLVMVVSMLVSILAYSAVWTPEFAIGLIAMMLIHEFGHVIAMNKEGFATKAPVFIPFLGAMLFSPKGMDRRQEAVIGIGGVILGGIACLITLGLYFIYPSSFLLLISFMGIALNLFQLIPILPLDGGRVIQAVGKNFQFIGLLALALLTVVIKQPSIFLVWIIVFFDLSFFSVKQRIIGASLIELALVVFTVFWIGIPDSAVFWVCVVDSVVGGLYVAMIAHHYKRDKNGIEAIFNQSNERPQLPSSQRWSWLAIYLLTVAILFGALVLMVPMLTQIKPI